MNNSLVPARESCCVRLGEAMKQKRLQRGVGSLVISLILLFSMTLIAFFVNRSLIFEQKTSANQYRATRAFEAAEAGIEWATAQLNDVRFTNASCVAGGAGATNSFRTRYLNYTAAGGFTPLSTVQPGCSISSTGAGVPTSTCVCPTAGNPALASATDPTFTVKFERLTAANLPNGTLDSESVLVTSTGCTSADVRCVPGATGTADAFQRISVILKLKPSLQSVPAAAITTGGSLRLTSSASLVENTDRGSNGLLVNAGAGINNVAVAGCNGSAKDFQTTNTLPGSPWQNAMVQNDASLSSLSANPDAMFQSYFGSTISQYKTDRATAVLGASNSCANPYADIVAAYNQGFRAFYTDCEFQTNTDLGSLAVAGDAGTGPISFVTSNGLKFNGGANIWGLVYGDQATWDQVGLGNGSINGALVVRGNYCANANADYKYNADALKTVRGSTGTLVRVPGSWKDY